jgi:hypothetical protein
MSDSDTPLNFREYHSKERNPAHFFANIPEFMPGAPAQNNRILNEDPPSSREVTMFENIMQEIRGMNVLSSYQIYYLKDMPKDKLLRIIELYNVVMRNVNEIL